MEALAALPDDDTRGMRFIGIDRSESYDFFADLRVEAQRCARKWMRLGFAKGSPVALIVDDNRDFVRAFLGAVIAGLVPVPIHPRPRFKRLAAYCDAVAQIVEAACTRAVITNQRQLPIIERLLGRKLRDGGAVECVMAVEDLMALDEESNCVLPTVSPDDICFLQFTSSSQSTPKSVSVTHANIVAHAKAAWGSAPGLEGNDSDVAISWLPLFHDMGLIGFVLGPIVCNVSSVLLPTEAFARRPAVWLETISRCRGTITFAPNFAYAMATKHVRDDELQGIDLSTLRIAGCGSEPINPDVMRAFADRFAAVGFRAEALTPTYGLADIEWTLDGLSGMRVGSH